MRKGSILWSAFAIFVAAFATPARSDVAAFNQACVDRGQQSKAFQDTFDVLLDAIGELRCDVAAAKAGAVTSLDVGLLAYGSPTGIDIHAVSALPSLQELVVSTNLTESLQPLRNYPSLTSVVIRTKDLFTLAEIGRVPSIVNFRFFDQLDAMPDFSIFPEVRSLDFKLWTYASDVTPLYDLVHLESLKYQGPAIDLSRLTSIHHLKTLDILIGDDAAPNLAPLVQADHLISLRAKVTNPQDVARLPALEHLTLVDPAPDFDYQALESSATLREIDLEVTGPDALINLLPLASKFRIRSLKYRGEAALPDLGALVDLERLDLVSIAHGLNVDFSALRELRALKSVFLAPEFITHYFPVNLTGIDSLTSLAEFGCGYCVIDDLRPIAGVTGLTTFRWFGANRPVDLAPFAANTRLRLLSVVGSGMQAVSTAGLSALHDLETLELRSLTLDNLDFLGAMPKLTKLVADYTTVRDTSGLRQARGLETLLINNINSPRDIANLARLRLLRIYEHFDTTVVGQGWEMPMLRFLTVSDERITKILLGGMPRILGMEVANSSLAEWPDMSRAKRFYQVSIYQSHLDHIPDNNLQSINVSSDNPMTLDFKAPNLKYLTAYKLSKIDRSLEAPQLQSIMAAFADGTLSADTCPVDHPNAVVARFCTYTLGQ